MGFVSRTTGNLFRILLTLGALALVFYIIIEFRIWSMDWTDYFLKRGRFEEIIFVILVAMAITMVIVWLLKWHLRAQGR